MESNSRAEYLTGDGTYPPETQALVSTPKINIEPENDGLEDMFPLPEVYPQVPCSSSGAYQPQTGWILSSFDHFRDQVVDHEGG